MITALAGGVGAARLLRGLVRVVPENEVTVIVNTGDDTVMHGLHVSPDVDTVLYTLSGLNDDERGWGLADETWNAMEALERLGGDAWFRLGDKDLATHLYRTGRLSAGASLSQVTAELCGSLGIVTRLIPMSDDPVRTRLKLVAGPEVSFQDYFVRMRHEVAVESVRFDGAERAEPSPGVIEAIANADVIVVCPSNPFISIGPILAVPHVAEALSERRSDVVAISPIVAGAALKGPADRLLSELGHSVSVTAIASIYAPFVSTLVIDEADTHLAEAVEGAGVRCVVTKTVMHTPGHAAELARVSIDEIRGSRCTAP